MSERVVVAMSGGVDSSVAAAMMVDAGKEVIGITMSLVQGASRCCSLDDAEDARRVAEQLGIPFYVANYKREFEAEVMEPFADAYLAGRTPIPCVGCNSRFKFRYLLERAAALGADTVVTGHYARIERSAGTGALDLLRGTYRAKDQSYFLFDLTQEQLARIRFPLGDMTKSEVRSRARELGLNTAEKPESQEICFAPDGDYASVVERLRPDALPGAGSIRDGEGRELGRHGGVHHFTVGQRKGLGLTGSERLYVTGVEANTNTVFVGEVEDLDLTEARVENPNWISGRVPDGPLEALVQVRYRHEGAEARIEPLADGSAQLRFEKGVRAVTPGQAAVFYEDEHVLGGGWISASSG